MRRDNLDRVWGGGAADALEARGELGARAKQAVQAGASRGHALPNSIDCPHGDHARITGAVRDDESTIVVDESSSAPASGPISRC